MNEWMNECPKSRWWLRRWQLDARKLGGARGSTHTYDEHAHGHKVNVLSFDDNSLAGVGGAGVVHVGGHD